MKLFIDDVRNPPDSSWVIARNGSVALECLLTGTVVEISFDNDLGLDSIEGWQIANWLEEKCFYGTLQVPERMVVHSANPPAKRRIEATIEAIIERGKD